MGDTKKGDYDLLSNKSQLTRKVLISMKYIGDNIITLIKTQLERNI